MDRNEKQNSFRNIQNSRGFDKKLKKYKTAFHISLAAAVIFAGSTGALGVQYLKNQDTAHCQLQHAEDIIFLAGTPRHPAAVR